ncbi:MAG: STM3941 family protein [Acidobacteriota bacterium]
MTGFALAGYALMFVLGLSRFEMVVYGLMITIVLVYVLKEFRRSDAKVIIDRHGVLDKRLRMGTIRWHDIKGIYIKPLKSIDHICLEVANEQRYLSRRSTLANLAAKFLKATNKISPFNINTGVLDASCDEIYCAIVHGCEYYASAVPED